MTRPVAPAGRTLLTGPSNAGKTRATAHAIRDWVENEGAQGVVVLDFAPDHRKGAQVVGRPLATFLEPPEGVWWRHVASRAPRLEARTDDEAVRLAQENAESSDEALGATPPRPRAVFVNDATIPFHAPGRDPTPLLAYAAGARRVVLNALDTADLGTDDPVSRQEQAVLARLRSWADHEVRLRLPDDATFLSDASHEEGT